MCFNEYWPICSEAKGHLLQANLIKTAEQVIRLNKC